jgi:hypothetical protein
MFAKMKSGRGLSKELLKRLEQKKVELLPETLTEGNPPIEMTMQEVQEEVKEGVVEVEVDDSDNNYV